MGRLWRSYGVRAYGGGMTDTFSNLVDTFKNVGVARAYGDPVQLGGQEVIPVALVTFGFGGGAEGEADGGASGGGGGGMVLPLGVYRNDGGSVTTYKTRYRLWDKLLALTLLGRKLQLFVDKIEVENVQDQLYRELLRSLKEGGQSN